MVINTNNGYNSSQNTNSRDNAAVENKANANADTTKPASSGLASGSDKVVLSPQAKAFGKLAANVAKAPEIDNEKVAEIKKAIAEGSFEVNAERIAEKMLSHDSLF